MSKERTLSEATDNYDCQEQEGIFPISNEDANIIQLLNTILQLTDEKELKGLMKNWKIQPDRWLADKLTELSENYLNKKAARYFVKLGQSLFNVFQLHEIESLDRYSDEKTRMTYCILINKSPNENMIYGNRMIEFLTAEQRDNELETLQNKLKEFTNIKFL